MGTLSFSGKDFTFRERRGESTRDLKNPQQNGFRLEYVIKNSQGKGKDYGIQDGLLYFGYQGCFSSTYGQSDKRDSSHELAHLFGLL